MLVIGPSDRRSERAHHRDGRWSRPTRSVAIGLALAVLGLAACGGGSSNDSSPETAVEGKPASGGTLTYLTPQEMAATFDPVSITTPVGQTNEGPRGFAVYDALVVLDPDTGALAYRIAESMESTDSVVWTLRLRPDVKFSDGTTLDAEAVKFNWTRTADPANKSPKATSAQSIATMDVVDATTLTITLKAANAFFPSVVALDLPYIGSPTAIQADPTGFGSNPVGAGAYTLKEWVRDDHQTFVRNPTYYGETYVDEIVVRVIPDADQLYNTFTTTTGAIAHVTNLATLADAKDGGYQFRAATPNGGRDISFNTTKPPFDDVRARRAVTMALDPDAINEALYAGLGVPTRSVFAKTSPHYDESIGQPEFDADGAQALLDELAAEGKPLSFSLLATNSGRKDAEFIQAQLANYDNIDVTIESLGGDGDAIPRVRAGTFHAWVLAMAFMDPGAGLQANFGTTGTQNWAHYSNPIVDAELAKARETTDEKAQAASFDLVQTQIAEDVPYALTIGLTTAVIYKDDVVMDLDGFYQLTPDWTKIWLASS